MRAKFQGLPRLSTTRARRLGVCPDPSNDARSNQRDDDKGILIVVTLMKLPSDVPGKYFSVKFKTSKENAIREATAFASWVYKYTADIPGVRLSATLFRKSGHPVLKLTLEAEEDSLDDLSIRLHDMVEVRQ